MPALGPFGGFWSPESPAHPTGCGIPGCRVDEIAPTDTYCHDHDGFMPLAKMTNRGRATLVAMLSMLIYGSLELTALSNSTIPVDLSYLLVGLGAILLPLRYFGGASSVAATLWVIVGTLSITFQFVSGHIRIITATIYLTIAAIICTLIAGLKAHAISHDEVARPETGVLALAATILTGAAGSTVLCLTVFVDDYLWHGRESATVLTALGAAAALFAMSMVAAIAGGFIYGPGNIDKYVNPIKYPPKPRLVSWQYAPVIRGRRQARDAIDRMAQVLTLTALRISRMTMRISVTAACKAVNFIKIANYLLSRLLISFLNQLKRLIILTIRRLLAGLTAALKNISQALAISTSAGVTALVNIESPLVTIAATALLTTAVAQETRRYIAAGTIGELLRIIAVAIAAFALADVTWIVLATQPFRQSVASAQHSAERIIPHLLFFIAAGGWLLGLPGTFGYGRIHVGWLTIGSTSLIVAILLGARLKTRSHGADE